MSSIVSEASFDEKPSSRHAGRKPTSAGEDGGVRDRREIPTKKKDQDSSAFISKEEFCNIWFDYQWPKIITDLARYLTGMNLLSPTRIQEAEELPSQQLPAEMCKDIDLSVYRGPKMSIQQYTWIVNCFRTFQGAEQKAQSMKDVNKILEVLPTYQETQIYLEEKDFVNNTGKVFGQECPYFGKLLYLFMSGGYDRQRISLLKFIECLMPLHSNENRLQFNRLAFQILDFDRDQVLNILNILHMWKNIDPRS